MAHDIYAMYLSHYYTQKVKGHSAALGGHSLRMARAFFAKDRMLVIHHLVLLLFFLPVTLVKRGEELACEGLIGTRAVTPRLLVFFSFSDGGWATSSSAASSSQSSARLSCPWERS